MSLLQFTTNKDADDPAAIHSACRFDETDEICTATERENLYPLRLLSNAFPTPTLPDQYSRVFGDLSPTNPAILLARSVGAADTRPFVCSAITIVSSARTMELYISGEYIDTFRGESFLPSASSFTPTTNAGASPPLFLIQIDQESLLHRCHNLLFKGALPPTSASQNSSQTVTAAALASESNQPVDSPSRTQSDTNPAYAAFTGDTNGSTAITSTLNNISDGSLTSPNFTSAMASAHSYTSLPGNSNSTIDLDKVRQMLSQVQIDNMPQGAKDLMRTMEMQSIAQRALAIPSSTAFSVGNHSSPTPITSPPSPLSYTAASPDPAAPPTLITATPSLPGTAVEASPQPTSTFVTRAELSLMEMRIMAKIEQRFQEMEETILNKLLAAKQPNV
ncbi:hypothetical protein EC991_004299 [Linnemannia zychae]|nr:hypothetical protein EC991_004299 [Linnemannia zychae]